MPGPSASVVSISTTARPGMTIGQSGRMSLMTIARPAEQAMMVISQMQMLRSRMKVGSGARQKPWRSGS